jgi:hypothetical protein
MHHPPYAYYYGYLKRLFQRSQPDRGACVRSSEKDTLSLLLHGQSECPFFFKTVRSARSILLPIFPEDYQSATALC